MADPVIKIKQGSLRGKIGKDIEGNEYYSFQGIPYAKPPVGKLRFRAPQPPDCWNGVIDATKEGSGCYSRHMLHQNVIGQEDCLFLNVHTPKLPNASDAPKPVMVWIPGGSFTKGSGTDEFYGPDFLIAEEVVIVTVNYRLGILGFLSFEDSSLGVPGNAAFKDMVLALKWVQENIVQFSGDPNNVTLFGESAGGAAVHLLMLSSMTKGLCHRVIAQSGCGLNVWTLAKRCSEELHEILGLKNKDDKKLLDILEALPVDQLFAVQEKLKDPFTASDIRPFGVIVESASQEPAFLKETPLDIIKAGTYNKVPLILGYTTREGILFEIFSKRLFGTVALITEFENAVPYPLNFTKGSDNSKLAAARIKEFYYGDEYPSLENIDSYYLLQTDNFFLRDIYKTVEHHLKTSTTPVYLYRFSIESKLNFYKVFHKHTSPGVCHADDLGYLFKNFTTPEINRKSVDYATIKRMTGLWSNFAKTGDPNPAQNNSLINVKWAPAQLDKVNFLDIGENLTVGVNPEEGRMKFWKKIYELNSQ